MSTLIRKTWRKPNFCPACRSRNIGIIDSPPGWQCADCGQFVQKAVPPSPYTLSSDAPAQAPMPAKPPAAPKRQPPPPAALTRAPSSFTVVEILEIGRSALSQSQWLIVRTADNQAVIFWGRADNFANLDAVRHHALPFSVTCETYATGKFGANWAVHADTPLHIG